MHPLASSSPPIRPIRRQHPALAVVIVNYNGWDDVARLVQTLACSREVASGCCELVIVDNASSGPVPAALREPRAGVRLILQPENGGFAAGVNAGWRASPGDWVLVLNPDVVPGTDLLGQVLSRLERFATDAPGIVGFGLRNGDGSRQPSVGAFPSLARSVWEQLIPRARRKYQAGWRTKSGPVAWVTGACVLFNAQMLRELGGMDEDFFLYYEEVALCRAAWRAGWRVEYDPSIEVIHLRPLQNRRLTPALRVITRHSKLLYFRKHLPRWQFRTLCAIVALEARLGGLQARVRGAAEDARAWRTIGWLAAAMQRGEIVRGTDVRALAEAVAAPTLAAAGQRRTDAAAPIPQALGAVRTERPGTSGAQLRKDGPACR